MNLNFIDVAVESQLQQAFLCGVGMLSLGVWVGVGGGRSLGWVRLPPPTIKHKQVVATPSGGAGSCGYLIGFTFCSGFFVEISVCVRVCMLWWTGELSLVCSWVGSSRADSFSVPCCRSRGDNQHVDP